MVNTEPMSTPEGYLPRSDKALPGDQRRLDEINTLIHEAFANSIRLFLLLALILLASGEVGFEAAGESGSLVFRLLGSSETLPFWLLGILGWDIIMFAITRSCFPKVPIEESLLSLGLTAVLWRLVWLNLALFFQPSTGILPPAPASWPAVFLFATVLIAGKEIIARNLLVQDGRQSSPLLAVWGWHSRKDAVFTLVFICGWWLHHRLAVRPDFVHSAGSLIRALLLGSATLAICHRGVRAIRSSALDQASETPSPSPERP